jgi:hypothetical protein
MPGCSIKSGLAAPLAQDGDPEPIHIEETDANFTLEWKGDYRTKVVSMIDRGNVGIIRSPVRASILPDRAGWLQQVRTGACCHGV